MNEELARRAKRYAIRHRRTFTEVVEQAMSELLARERSGGGRASGRVELPVVGDPKRRVTDDLYRRAVEEMYEQEALDVIRGGQ
jgi:hypothetical protein